jgi:hypothetical protein
MIVQTNQIPYKTLQRKHIQLIKLGQDHPNNNWKRSYHVYNFDQSRHKYNNIHNSHVLLKGTYAVLKFRYLLKIKILYTYIPMIHQVILLIYKVSTSTSNQDMSCQHPSNIICHIILHNNKTLK